MGKWQLLARSYKLKMKKQFSTIILLFKSAIRWFDPEALAVFPASFYMLSCAFLHSVQHPGV
jgi:hypothetical protein